MHVLTTSSGMRVEYAKARGRALRWSEEVLLVKEEMRRVLQYFNWKIEWWTARAKQISSQKNTAAKGFVAYANLQASYLKDIGQRFRRQWTEECNMINLPEVVVNNLIPVV